MCKSFWSAAIIRHGSDVTENSTEAENFMTLLNCLPSFRTKSGIVLKESLSLPIFLYLSSFLLSHTPSLSNLSSSSSRAFCVPGGTKYPVWLSQDSLSRHPQPVLGPACHLRIVLAADDSVSFYSHSSQWTTHVNWCS